MLATPEEVVTALAPLFEALTYDPDASRSLHLQAGGFFWSDETPDLRANGEFPVSITRFMIALVSYRMTVMRGVRHEAFTPYWDALKRCCPSWPGFRPERSDSALVEELDRELNAQHEQLERLLKICERKRHRSARNRGVRRPSGSVDDAE